MLKLIWSLFIFAFENLPNIGFWIGVLIYFNDWYTQLNPFIQLIIIAIPISSIILIILKLGRGVKSHIWKANIETGLKESANNLNVGKVDKLLRNTPSRSVLTNIYEYAKNYALTWASDGILQHVNYYINLDGNHISKSAQIFIQSKLRNEILTIYLPQKPHQIEEIEETTIIQSVALPPIYLFKHWSEALKKSIENSSADIAKSDITNIQISPDVNSLSFIFYFKKSNREWKSSYCLEASVLKKASQEIFIFT